MKFWLPVSIHQICRAKSVNPEKKKQLNQLIIDKLAAPLWREEVRDKQVRCACVSACWWKRAHKGVTPPVQMQLLTVCASWRKQGLLWKDRPKKMSKETEHEKGSRHLFKLVSAVLQAAAMVPGIFHHQCLADYELKLYLKEMLSTENQESSKRKAVSGV